LVGITLTGLTQPYFGACPNQDLDFQHFICVMFFFMFNDLRWQVIVCFVDIGGIVGHHI
jgi:hypothetical protein